MYAMSCFRLLESLLRELESRTADFWWTNKEDRKVHSVAWNKLCTRKAAGGMGFHELRAFNLAMLAKQGLRWHIGSAENVCIWIDSWIPRLDHFKPISPPNYLPLDATVDRLIYSDRCTRNEDLIKSPFMMEDAQYFLLFHLVVAGIQI